MANEVITGNRTYRINEKLDINIIPPTLEETKKNSPQDMTLKHGTHQGDDNSFYYKRSTTQKARERVQQKRANARRNKSKNFDDRNDKSRGSSYNMTSDNNYDSLSINVANYGYKKKFKKN